MTLRRILVLCLSIAVAQSFEWYPWSGFSPRKEECIKQGLQCSSNCKTIIYCGGPDAIPVEVDSCKGDDVCGGDPVWCSPDHKCGNKPGNYQPKCSDKGWFPDPYTCHSYYFCAAANSPPLMSCDCGDKWYDPDKKECAGTGDRCWENSINCSTAGDPSPFPEYPKLYYLCVFDDEKELYAIVYQCPGETVFNSSTKNCGEQINRGGDGGLDNSRIRPTSIWRDIGNCTVYAPSGPDPTSSDSTSTETTSSDSTSTETTLSDSTSTETTLSDSTSMETTLSDSTSTETTSSDSTSTETTSSESTSTETTSSESTSTETTLSDSTSMETTLSDSTSTETTSSDSTSTETTSSESTSTETTSSESTSTETTLSDSTSTETTSSESTSTETTSSESTSTETTLSDSTSTETTLSDSTSTETTPSVGPTSEPPKCDSIGQLIADKDDCHSYYKCDANLIPQYRTCHPGTHFICISISVCGCVIGDCSNATPSKCTKPGEMFPYPGDCYRYYKCDDRLELQTRTCPTGTYFICVSPSQCACAIGTCPNSFY